mmetsp:Transcript_26488/g.51299  ORF Transcript_26488/g.51299 Transcript_26488/m.51299 type:complete len:237 (+) Transcript_26488:107-817(+)
MLPHRSTSMILQGPKIVTRPRSITIPVVALVPIPLYLSSNGLRQKNILILRIIISSLTNNWPFDNEFPPTFFGKVLGIGSSVKCHLKFHVRGHGIGTAHPSHERIAPSLSDLSLILKRNEPLRLLPEGGLAGPLRLLLANHNEFLLSIGSQRDLIHMGGIQRRHLRLVLGKFRVGEGVRHGEDGMRVDGFHFLLVLLDFGFFAVNEVPRLMVFGVVFGEGGGFGGRCGFSGGGGGG